MRRHAFILAAALAWLISIERAEAKLDILVDKATQRMFVMQDGYIRYMWPVSTGRDNTATPNGTYTPERLERTWFSTAYYNSPMPFSIFFHNGYAIHGSYAINQLGGPASHGCVRLHPYHAAVLFDLVQQEGPNNTSIEITDEGRPEQPPPGREIDAGPGESPPAPRGVYYAQAGGVPVPPLAVPDNRPIAWRNALLPKPAPAGRGMLTEIKSPANVPRALSVAREADPANGAPRLPNGSFDSRPKSRIVEGPRVSEGSFAARAQSALSTSSFKLLPASCWSGSAARWRWWASSGGTQCR
jgi:L,D-transpeptidase catalytic domain